MIDWLKRALGSMARGQRPLESATPSRPFDGTGDQLWERGVAEKEPPASELLSSLAAKATSVGDLESVTELYRKAVAIDAGNADLRLALGTLLVRQKMYGEADIHLGRAALLAPMNPLVCHQLGLAARASGDQAAAKVHFDEAIDLAPEDELGYISLAALLTSQNRFDEAESILLQGVAACTQVANLHFELATIYANRDDHERAALQFLAATEANPNFYEAHCNLGVVFLMRGDAAQATAHFEQALKIHPGYLPAHSGLLWLLTFNPEQSSHHYLWHARSYGEKVNLLASAGRQTIARAGADERERLRVGLVSGDLRNHPVGWFLEGVVRNLDKSRIELVAYSMNPKDDALSSRIRTDFAKWTAVAGTDDAELADWIREDRIDILLDLAGHSGYNRLPLFARKAAPIQASWMGYLASTGVSEIDYVFADRLSVPDAERGQFTEEVWYLPDTIFCFTPPPETATVFAMPPPALRNQYVTFGTFQRVNKLSDACLASWGRVLSRLPSARLRLQNGGLNSPQACQRLYGRLRQFGIASERVTILGPIALRADYLATYGEVDVVLDTFPHPGVTTTCEALWMGVPTVTLGGQTMLERIGASLLTCAGLSHWVAWTQEEYVDLAVRHACDIAGLASLRTQLRQRVLATPLFDARQFALRLEQALFSMWERRTQCSGG